MKLDIEVEQTGSLRKKLEQLSTKVNCKGDGSKKTPLSRVKPKPSVDKFEAADVYKFDSNSDSDALTVDMSNSVTTFEALKRGLPVPPTPLSVRNKSRLAPTSFKPPTTPVSFKPLPSPRLLPPPSLRRPEKKIKIAKTPGKVETASAKTSVSHFDDILSP